MTATSMVPPDVGSAVHLQNQAHSWEENPPTPDRAESLEQLVRGVLQQASILRLAWSLSTQEGEAWEMGWYRERVRVMEFLSDTVVDILARTQKILERCRQEYPEWPALALAGEVAASSHAAKDIATKVRQTRQWLERPQPPLNAEMIRHSQEALDRGEGEEISDLIARIEAEGPLVKE